MRDRLKKTMISDPAVLIFKIFSLTILVVFSCEVRILVPLKRPAELGFNYVISSGSLEWWPIVCIEDIMDPKIKMR